MSSGVVFNITEFAVHDGPGIRTTVFLKGCPLSCLWCHNPEGQSIEPEWIESNNGRRMCGKEWESEELADMLNRQAEILNLSGGGITFSGGEPMMQPDFVVDVISSLRNIGALVQTSGFAAAEVFQRVVSACDMVYFDLKIMDTQMHMKYTSQSNSIILDNIRSLDSSGKPYVIRVPLVPGITDTDANLEAIAALASSLKNVSRVDLLPYNRAAGGKYKACNRVFTHDWDENKPCNANTGIFSNYGIKACVS